MSLPISADLRSKAEKDKAGLTTVSLAAASFEHATFMYKAESPEVLRAIHLDIDQGSLVIVIGPVGSGKSTLLKALAGDITPVKGLVRLNCPEVAYCQQTPWLANSTVREAITGSSNLHDEDWYCTVRACCDLNEDIAGFPGGDEWKMGSAGITLSGGQKQRIVSRISLSSAASDILCRHRIANVVL